MALSGTDQRAVIVAALHRLLLLFMAESNVHFVVAPVLQHVVDMDRITESREDQTLGLVTIDSLADKQMINRPRIN